MLSIELRVNGVSVCNMWIVTTGQRNEDGLTLYDCEVIWQKGQDTRAYYYQVPHNPYQRSTILVRRAIEQLDHEQPIPLQHSSYLVAEWQERTRGRWKDRMDESA